MKQRFTSRFFSAFAILVLLGNILNAAGRMKDIEIDPGKGVNVGDQIWLGSTENSNEISFNFFFSQDGAVTLKVYDLNGREMSTPVTGVLGAGRTNQSIQDKNELPAGIYFVKVSHENGTELVKKFVVLH